MRLESDDSSRHRVRAVALHLQQRQEFIMRRLLTMLAAATLALSPVAFFGVTSGIQAAHADLGWCDECDMARPIGGRTPAPPPAPVGPFIPVAPIFGR